MQRRKEMSFPQNSLFSVFACLAMRGNSLTILSWCWSWQGQSWQVGFSTDTLDSDPAWGLDPRSLSEDDSPEGTAIPKGSASGTAFSSGCPCCSMGKKTSSGAKNELAICVISNVLMFNIHKLTLSGLWSCLTLVKYVLDLLAAFAVLWLSRVKEVRKEREELASFPWQCATNVPDCCEFELFLFF